MISAALILALTAQAPVAAKPAKTSLFLKCSAQGADKSRQHVLQMVFFDPKPSWAKGFNFYDPDKILPSGVRPVAQNLWPRLLEVKLDSSVGGNSALIQIAPEPEAPKAARLNVVITNAAGVAQPSFSGRCFVTEGAAAEAEFKGLMTR